MFPRTRRGSSLRRFDWKQNPEKELRQWKKGIPELKAELVCIVCGREKKISFEIYVIILRYIKNVNPPFKKDFKFAGLFTRTFFFF